MKGKSKAQTLVAWERRAEVPLILLAVAFLVAYAWPVIDHRLGADAKSVLGAISWTVWGAFFFDLAIRLWLADNKPAYAKRHWYDVALVALPLLRPLRLLRLLALVRILDRSATSSLAGRVLIYVSGATGVAIGLGGLAVLDAERDTPGANITTFGDAVWWAATTVTTVGYGDHFPVTTEGRLVAIVLIVMGIGVFGAVTATVTSLFLTKVEVDRAQHESAPASQLTTSSD